MAHNDATQATKVEDDSNNKADKHKTLPKSKHFFAWDHEEFPEVAPIDTCANGIGKTLDSQAPVLTKPEIEKEGDESWLKATTALTFAAPADPLVELLNNRDLSNEILSHLDVVSLVQTKAVCTLWRDCCETAIDAKGGKKKKAFTDVYDDEISELRNIIWKCVKGDLDEDCKERHLKQYFGRCSELRSIVVKYVKGNRDDIEDIAQEYGYPIGKWDVSQVTDFSCVFCDMETFNEDISEWNVSNATTMNDMFSGAEKFNQDLSSWDVSNVTHMDDMFGWASNFNGDLSPWDVSNVTCMKSMFDGASSFNGDLSRWDVSSVTDMEYMFREADSFNGNLSDWNVANVTNMCSMFFEASEFNGDLSNWDPASLRRCGDMFYNAPVNPDSLSWYRRYRYG